MEGEKRRRRALITMSPSGLCSILSMPLGPMLERMTRATALAARMLAFCASRPLMRLLRSCSYAPLHEHEGGATLLSGTEAHSHIIMIFTRRLCA